MDRNEHDQLAQKRLYIKLEEEWEELIAIQKKGEQLIREAHMKIQQLYQDFLGAQESIAQAHRTINDLEEVYFNELKIEEKGLLHRLEIAKHLTETE